MLQNRPFQRLLGAARGVFVATAVMACHPALSADQIEPPKDVDFSKVEVELSGAMPLTVYRGEKQLVLSPHARSSYLCPRPDDVNGACSPSTARTSLSALPNLSGFPALGSGAVWPNESMVTLYQVRANQTAVVQVPDQPMIWVSDYGPHLNPTLVRPGESNSMLSACCGTFFLNMNDR